MTTTRQAAAPAPRLLPFWPAFLLRFPRPTPPPPLPPAGAQVLLPLRVVLVRRPAA